ncbi:MAG: ATP-binding protein [Chloroflexota bacterium]
MSPSLADRLTLARHERFIGRGGEIALFKAALETQEFPFFVLHIFGPGGVGKTSLLREFSFLCQQKDVRPVYLDARNIEPSPDAFREVVNAALGVPQGSSPHDHLEGQSGRFALLVDTYETLLPLDTWLRTAFLPELPENILTVLAGRHPPAPAWQADPGWQALVRIVPLRNLSPDESRSLLSKRGLPTDRVQSVLDFTHGHPLALSLVADVFAQRGNVGEWLQNSPDVVKTLIERFVQQVPGPAHRAALEACALVRVTTETLLNEMLDMPATPSGPAEGTRQLFEWLRGLSFIEFSPEGLFPHDLAREALTADLRWRNPDWYTELHRRSRVYYTAQIEKSGGQAQQRALMDLVFLHRENAAIRSFFEFQAGSALPESMKPGDAALLCPLVETYEGPKSAGLASYWFDKQPQGVTVWRNPDGLVAGFMAVVALHETDAADRAADPAVRAAMDHLERRIHLRAGETALYFRFWMAAEGYQAVSPVQSLIFLAVVKYYLSTPRLAFTFFPCANADFWSPMLAYANLERLPEADFQVDGHPCGVYGHDWRAEPPAAWLAALAEKEVGIAPESASPVRAEPLIVLSEADFGEAVRQALHDFSRPALLKSNPLLRSRLVSTLGDEQEPVNLLRGLLSDTAGSLRGNPRDEKLFRALDRTYFQPAPTQEAAAELLDLPFSTYRRHLTAGIQRLTEILWEREIGGE